MISIDPGKMFFRVLLLACLALFSPASSSSALEILADVASSSVPLPVASDKKPVKAHSRKEKSLKEMIVPRQRIITFSAFSQAIDKADFEALKTVKQTSIFPLCQTIFPRLLRFFQKNGIHGFRQLLKTVPRFLERDDIYEILVQLSDHDLKDIFLFYDFSWQKLDRVRLLMRDDERFAKFALTIMSSFYGPIVAKHYLDAVMSLQATRTIESFASILSSHNYESLPKVCQEELMKAAIKFNIHSVFDKLYIECDLDLNETLVEGSFEGNTLILVNCWTMLEKLLHLGVSTSSTITVQKLFSITPLLYLLFKADSEINQCLVRNMGYFDKSTILASIDMSNSLDRDNSSIVGKLNEMLLSTTK